MRLLRLHGPDDAAVRRGALLVEDALRTASLPGADRGRLYIVRRLSLGAIDPSLPPAAIAVEIERRFEALRVTAVHAESDGAASARAVYFHDDVEPFVLLARRVATGAAVSAWFWPLAVRGYTPSLPAPKALEVTLAGALDTPAGAAAVVRMTAELGEAALDALCGALRPGTGEALLLRCNWGAPPAVVRELVRGAPALGGIARLAPPWPRVLRRWVARWGAADARAVWLAAVAACAGSPSLAADPRLSARGAQLAMMAANFPEAGAAEEPADDAAASRPPIEAPRAEQPELEAEVAAPRAAGVPPDAAPVAGSASSADIVAPSAEPVRPAMPAVQPGDAVSPASPAPAVPTRPSAPPSVAAPSVAASPPAAGEGATAPRRGRSSGREPLWHGVPMATAAGGLPLVIRPLMRLGITDWLRDHPAALRGGFPVRLMAHIGAWCGVSPDDPALAVFDPPAEPLPELAAEPPEVWRHVFGEATWQALSRRPAGAPATWRLAVSLWLRRVARLPLGRVVRRPGRVVATRTHVDVLFPLAAADVRVRAAALDVNPGWVPWLGRIVQFHYLEEV
ncbi:hypothetical protein WME90_41980 [Sorangium sp. So ce375]|uniref:hypothetical protein n=1 Tax=Sorangium sp. So ce375 TaxID=3133306 RepID=UPI003F5CB227